MYSPVNVNGDTSQQADEAARPAGVATGHATPETTAAPASTGASARPAAANAISGTATGLTGAPADNPQSLAPTADAHPAGPSAKSSSAARKAAKKARAAKAANTVSPKTWATTVAGAIAFSFWTIAAATFWKGAFSTEAIAALTASTTTIVAAAAAYLKRDRLRAKK